MSFDELMKYGNSIARALELIPAPEECKRVYEIHKSAFERGFERFENGTRNLGAFDGFMNLTRAGVSLIYDPILASAYFVGGILGLSSKLKKNKFPLVTAAGSGTISAVAMSLYFSGLSGGEEMNPWAMLYLSIFDDFTTFPIIGWLGYYESSKKKIKQN